MVCVEGGGWLVHDEYLCCIVFRGEFVTYGWRRGKEREGSCHWNWVNCGHPWSVLLFFEWLVTSSGTVLCCVAVYCVDLVIMLIFLVYDVYFKLNPLWCCNDLPFMKTGPYVFQFFKLLHIFGCSMGNGNREKGYPGMWMDKKIECTRMW